MGPQVQEGRGYTDTRPPVGRHRLRLHERRSKTRQPHGLRLCHKVRIGDAAGDSVGLTVPVVLRAQEGGAPACCRLPSGGAFSSPGGQPSPFFIFSPHSPFLLRAPAGMAKEIARGIVAEATRIWQAEPQHMPFTVRLDSGMWHPREYDLVFSYPDPAHMAMQVHTGTKFTVKRGDVLALSRIIRLWLLGMVPESSRNDWVSGTHPQCVWGEGKGGRGGRGCGLLGAPGKRGSMRWKGGAPGGAACWKGALWQVCALSSKWMPFDAEPRLCTTGCPSPQISCHLVSHAAHVAEGPGHRRQQPTFRSAALHAPALHCGAVGLPGRRVCSHCRPVLERLILPGLHVLVWQTGALCLDLDTGFPMPATANKTGRDSVEVLGVGRA